MIRLPEGFSIYFRDRHLLSGSEWEVRVAHWNANKLDWYPVFKMIKQVKYTPSVYYEAEAKYAARFMGPGSQWIHFDTVEDLCIVMTTRYRMSIR